MFDEDIWNGLRIRDFILASEVKEDMGLAYDIDKYDIRVVISMII